MTIEELKAEWLALQTQPDLWEDGIFAQKYMDKLLAVAEAAYKHSDGCADVYGDIHLLDKALNDLLEDK